MNNLYIIKLPWRFQDLREQRLRLILQILQGRKIILIINEIGDRKKGNKTDYVKRQYIENLGKVKNGIVAVTAYGLLRNRFLIAVIVVAVGLAIHYKMTTNVYSKTVEVPWK